MQEFLEEESRHEIFASEADLVQNQADVSNLSENLGKEVEALAGVVSQARKEVKAAQLTLDKDKQALQEMRQEMDSLKVSFNSYKPEPDLFPALSAAPLLMSPGTSRGQS